MSTKLIFGEPIPVPQCPGWFKGGTATQKRHAYAGRHPTGKRLGPATETCGNCANLKRYRASNPDRVYAKCSLYPVTNGPGTDIRHRWPACELWKAKA